jgi:hypothetical protein
MIRYAFPAAVAALAFSATAALAQTAIGQPVQLNQPANPMTTNASTDGTITGQPQPGPNDNYGQPPQMGMPLQPGMMPMGMMPAPPGSVWIAGHYNWDPHGQNYVWIEGQFIQPPHPGAQWVAGHWQQTPNAWVWVDEHWS